MSKTSLVRLIKAFITSAVAVYVFMNAPSLYVNAQYWITRAKPNETFVSLDAKPYTLNPDVLVIADSKNPLAIAGIKGGKESGVTEKTHTIILESANFDPVRIRSGSRALGFKTDASYRFERGLDPNETQVAIDQLAGLIQEIAGGTILQGRADIYPRKISPQKILLRTEYAGELIGEPLSPAFYKNSFTRLGWTYKAKSKNSFIVEPPANRLDIRIEEDVIEEIVRVLGYEKIQPRMPEIPLTTAGRAEERYWEEQMRDLAAAAGYTESLTYEFIGERELRQFRIDPQSALEIENPARPETQFLVPRIILKYIQHAAENLREHDLVQIFGIAKSFPPSSERKDLVLVSSRKETSEAEEFYRLKGIIEQMLERMGISDPWFDDASVSDPLFHPQRAAEIRIGEEKIGVLGELHPAILQNLKTRNRIAAAEIYFDKLWRLARSETEYRPVNKYPAVIRDIAVIVPEEVRTTEVENIIESRGGKLLIDTDLFDYFQDAERLGEGRKNLAFHLVFQSPERTLTDKEVNDIVQKITAALEENDLEIRK